DLRGCVRGVGKAHGHSRAAGQVAGNRPQRTIGSAHQRLNPTAAARMRHSRRDERNSVMPLCRLAPCLAAFLVSFLAVSADAAPSLPTSFTDDTIVGSLSEPTDFAFLPDGRIVITEQRTGRVRLLVNGHVAATDPMLTVPSLEASGNEQGLLAVAIDPGW